MSRKKSKLRGLKTLVHDGVNEVVDLVGVGNASGGRFVTTVTDQTPLLRTPVRLAEAARMNATYGVLNIVKLSNAVVEHATDAAIDFVSGSSDSLDEDTVPLRSDIVGTRGWWQDASVALINGAVGDHLAETDNPLDQGLSLRFGIDRPQTAQRVAIFVHGLATTEWSWFLNSESYYGDPSVSFATKLHDDEGFVPVFVRYNTGRPVDENGADLSNAIGELLASDLEIEEILIVGHSMGGLVARAAAASPCAQQWVQKVSQIVYLGSPHAGAPLAKLATVLASAFEQVDLPAYQVLGKILSGRSGGIQDLAVGASTPELVPDVEHIFVAATVFDTEEKAVGNLVGDLLVQVSSAHGGVLDSRRVKLKRYRAGRVSHNQLQNHPLVYDMLLSVLRADVQSE